MDTIVLYGKRELDIYMNPQRQNLIRCMKIAGVPMTPKQLSEQIGISPSSVQHHIRQLRELGLVELDHTELIHGITASYYRILPRTVQIGSLVHDENKNQRLALLQAELSQVFSGFTAYCETSTEAAVGHRQFGDMISGITHLTAGEAVELYGMICAFLASHEERGEATRAWEYALIAYPVTEEKDA
ncbi:MAG: helix-turn-helix domain-containing protein [Christensenella sp.]|nr:helix-turn-helix domain-containing protein [Christensenella sp.]